MMTEPDWTAAVKAWQRLSPEEQWRRSMAHIPRKVARSMAFEGEPVSLEILEAALAERLASPRKDHSGGKAGPSQNPKERAT